MVPWDIWGQNLETPWKWIQLGLKKKHKLHISIPSLQEIYWILKIIFDSLFIQISEYHTTQWDIFVVGFICHTRKYLWWKGFFTEGEYQPLILLPRMLLDLT